jgi:hypothetical protein
MRASLLARAGSLAAAAAIATTGAMATAGAAGAATTHPRRLPTHLAIAKVSAVAHHPRLKILLGDLTSHRVPLRGKTVYLDRRIAHHKWAVVGHEVTDKRGAVAFVVDPRKNAHFVLVFRGGPNFSPSRSRVVTVKG